MQQKHINAWRVESLQLPPLLLKNGLSDLLDSVKPPILIASSKLCCGPKHEIPEDYPENIHLNGFIFVKPTLEENIDSNLRTFMNNSKS